MVKSKKSPISALESGLYTEDPRKPFDIGESDDDLQELDRCFGWGFRAE